MGAMRRLSISRREDVAVFLSCRCATASTLAPIATPRRLRQIVRAASEGREMDEFGGGFLRNALIGFGLAIAFSIVYVWFK